MKTNKLFLKVCNLNETNSKNMIFSENIFTILDLLTTELNVIVVHNYNYYLLLNMINYKVFNLYLFI